MSRWAQNLDDESIQMLIRSVGELEIKSLDDERAHNQALREYLQVFHDILIDREQLNGG